MLLMAYEYASEDSLKQKGWFERLVRGFVLAQGFASMTGTLVREDGKVYLWVREFEGDVRDGRGRLRLSGRAMEFVVGFGVS